MEEYLTKVRTWNYLELKLLCARIIARNVGKFVAIDFPFHLVGKITLLEVFKRMNEGYDHGDFLLLFLCQDYLMRKKTRISKISNLTVNSFFT
jgi:hypothetical protein